MAGEAGGPAQPGAARKPALGAEGWFSESDGPVLIGSRCIECGVVAFPPVAGSCPNPTCRSREHLSHPLSSTGTVWSYTNAGYQPPPPYVSRGDTFEPFGIVAVALDDDDLVVLGQLADGHDIGELTVGAPVELAIEPLFVDDDGTEHTIWKWRPARG